MDLDQYNTQCFNKQLAEHNVLLLEPELSVSHIRNGLQPRVYYIFFFRKSSQEFHRASEHFLQIAKTVQQENLQREGDSPDKQHCIAVDLQLCPTELSKEEIPKENTICFYFHNRYIELDIITAQEKLNLVRITERPKPLSKPPLKRAIVVLPCPLSKIEKCPGSQGKWLCDKCRATIEYSFESEEMYCDCGSFPTSSCTFRCDSELHGIDFVPGEQLQEHLKRLPPVKSINILVLGETGVGQSTWINAVANYMTYSTFNQAMSAEELLYLIPAEFDIDDENGTNHVIKLGQPDEDREFCFAIGQSSTQIPKAYVLLNGDHNVRFIITPGIMDIRGVEGDIEIFSKIMAYLECENVEYLNGICILLKPDVNRLSIQFRFCIMELLKHLHSSAADNIVFCFTNARKSEYKFNGSTKRILGLAIQECTKERGGKIKMKDNTMFAFENESFLYLAALHQGITFSDENIKICDQGWAISKNEYDRFLVSLQSKSPHQLKGTISLNEAWNLTNAIIQPMATIRDYIKLNLIELEKVKDETLKEGCQMFNKGDENIVLLVKQVKLRTKRLKYPSVVCNDSSCSHIATDSETGATKVTYKAVREENSNAFFRFRTSFWRFINFDKTCKACGHDKSLHDVITYNNVQDVYFKEVADFTELNKTIADQETLRVRVPEIIGKFAKFLRVNALVTNEDVYVDYIQREIDILRSRPAKSDTENDFRQQKISLLLRLIQDYVKVRNSIDTDTEDKECISAEKVLELRDELYSIPEIAEYLKDTMSARARSYENLRKNKDIIFDVRSKRKFI